MVEYLKIPEVAQRLDVSEKTARRYVKAGEMPSVFIGGAYRVSEEDLEKYLEAAKVRPGDGSGKAPESLLTMPFEMFMETIKEAANKPHAADARRDLEALVEQFKGERDNYLAAENSDHSRLLHRGGRIMSLLQAACRREFWEQIKDLDEDTLEEIYRDIERQRAEAHSQLEQAKEQFNEGTLAPADMAEFYRRVDDITSKSLLASFQLHALKHPEHRDQTEQEAEKILVGAAT